MSSFASNGRYISVYNVPVSVYNVSRQEVFQEFTEEAWLGLAEKIIVKDKGTYIVKFMNGIEISVEA